MNKTDEFCITLTSAEIGELYEREDPYLIDENERQYIDPERLNKLLQATDPNLWIVVLRNALDHLNDLQSRCGEDEIDGSKVKDILTTSKRCVLILASTYCRDHIQELRERADIKDSDRKECTAGPTDVRTAEPTDVRTADQTTNNAETATESVPKRKKPSNSALEKSLEELHTEQAKTIFEHLHKAGYLESDYKPINKKRAFVAFMAYTIGYGLFDIWNWSSVFTYLWLEETHIKKESQYHKKGLSAHLKNPDSIWETNSYYPLKQDRKEFIWELAKAIEAMSLNSTGAQRILNLAKRNGYTSTKR